MKTPSEDYQPSSTSQPNMADPLHLIIIGAGLAGLSAAISTKIANPNHKVTILEGVSELAEVGAGLQLTPNATRLFAPWGLRETLNPAATTPQILSVHRYDGTKRLAHSPTFQQNIASRYQAPFWGMHRVDLQRTMASRCSELGINIRLSSKVTSVDFETATVTINNGEKVEGDVVLCCDGLWSSTRAQFLGKPSPAILTGDLAYRIVINTEELTGPDAPELKRFIEDQTVNFWIGGGTHVVAYTMRGTSVYNIVLLCPDNLPADVSKTEGDLEEMRSLFVGWDPILVKFLNQVKSVAKWKLMWLDPLEHWANSNGTFLMAGDSCHPMLPYLAQGANSSLEDGAVFGYLLGKVNPETKKEQLPKMASVYEGVRKERGERIQRETFRQREDFHMVDGEEQQLRDLKLVSGEQEGEGFPSRWTCPVVQRWLYGYDAYEEAKKGFEENPF